jgi:spermidine synthase
MKRARLRAFAVLALLVVTLAGSARITQFTETALYGGQITLARQSQYQRIVLTEKAGDFSLYLNGNLQFSSKDEHRYHEALVHPAMSSAAQHARVLIGGGGDGLAAREVLSWPGVERVVLVDLDPSVTALGRNHPRLSELNEHSLSDPRVSVINRDAMTEFEALDEEFDVAILDFPDPSNYSLGKLYSLSFYRTVYQRLAPDGALSVQSTSPLFAPRAFWCVVTTLEQAGFFAVPYHAFVPSFGDWGYVLGTKRPKAIPTRLPEVPLGYLDERELANLFALPNDEKRVQSAVNRLNTQALVSYYLDDWGRFN